MNIQHKGKMINLEGLKAKEGFIMYRIFYLTRWLKEIVYCGQFETFEAAYSYVDYLQNKLPNGKKIVFKIETEQAQPRAA